MATNAKPQIEGEAPADYAGDVSAEEAWRVLKEDPSAVLVDVRTRAEWTFVGLADLGEADKSPQLVEWQKFPTMERNPDFEGIVSAALADLGTAAGTPVFFLCRSGARSKAAAIAMTAAGRSPCYNVAGGFEGDLDEDHHRGRVNGWKAAGLPWEQS